MDDKTGLNVQVSSASVQGSGIQESRIQESGNDYLKRGVLYAKVRSRKGLVFEGELSAITSYNQKGFFDILPGHTNFVSMIATQLVLVKADGKKEEMWVDKGVVSIRDNIVEIFTGVGIL